MCCNLASSLTSTHPSAAERPGSFTLFGVVSEEIQFFYLLFEVLVHRSPEHRRCSV